MIEPARQVDLIDTAPAFTADQVAALNARFTGRPTAEMLAELLTGELKGRIAVVSSFGAESAVLLDLVAAADRSVPLIFINTQKMFGETLAYRDSLAEQLGFTELQKAGDFSCSGQFDALAVKRAQSTLFNLAYLLDR